jgi:hypothetical protein
MGYAASMRTSSWLFCAAPLAAALASCGGGGGGAAPTLPIDPKSGPTFPSFVDVTATAGAFVPHAAVSGYRTTGTAWGDYDRDGHVDLFVTNQNGDNVLLQNLGNGTFAPSQLSSQVALPTAVSGGAVFADYDNDGWLDLYVCNRGPNVLFHNDAGQGFTNVTATAGVGDGGMGMSASFGDYDRDGDLDLYVTNWFCGACGGDPLQTMADKLYRNNGNGTFTNVTALLGATLTQGYGFIGSFLDYDNDGDADIYLVNDKGSPIDAPPGLPRNRNMLWRNDGPGVSIGSWVFTEVAVASGADARIDGMGVAVSDYDHDGDLDLAMTDNRPPTVLKNQGNGTFLSVATQLGLTTTDNNFGVLWADFNNDRHPDLFFASEIGNGMTYENLGNGTFSDISATSGLVSPGASYGCSYCDYDKDGWLDVVVSDFGYGSRLFRNPGLTSRTRNWFRARLRGAGTVNRDAVGARVYVRTADGLTQMQEVICGSSLGSGHDLALHFGLGTAILEEVRVKWPDGIEETFTGLTQNREWVHAHPAAL